MNEIRIVKAARGQLGLGRRSASRAENAGRRASPRDSLLLMATIRRVDRPDEEALPARVRNLSEIGLMADHPGEAVIGERVSVELRGIGAVAGKVAWVQEGRIGITFDVEVDPLLARKPVGGKAAPPSGSAA